MPVNSEVSETLSNSVVRVDVDRLRRLIRDSGMSQTQLAQRAFLMSPASIQSNSGRRTLARMVSLRGGRVRFKALERVAKVLGVDPKFLIVRPAAASRLTQTEVIQRRLREEIRSGRIAADEPDIVDSVLRHAAWFPEFNAHDREKVVLALFALQDDGLVRSDECGRFRVAVVADDEIDLLYAARLALEEVGISRVFGDTDTRRRQQVCEEMRCAWNAMRLAVEHDDATSVDVVDALAADVRFHHAWFLHYPVARELFSRSLSVCRDRTGSQLYRLLDAEAKQAHLKFMCSQLRQILDAVQEGVSDTAVKILKRHISSSWEMNQEVRDERAFGTDRETAHPTSLDR